MHSHIFSLTNSAAKPTKTKPSFASSTASPIAFRDPDEAEVRRRVYHEADVLIVGAGITGSALAVALGRQGRSVILLEKSLKEPNRIVGELLQPGGVRALEKLGLSDCLEGIDAVTVRGYDVIYHGTEVRIPYPKLGAPVRPEGRSFHHGRFVQKLREAALACPNVAIVEATANTLIMSSIRNEVLGVECSTANGQDCFFGSLTVVADGYNSKFRKEHHKHVPRVRSKFWALELIDADLPMPLHGHVILSDCPPILIYQIGTHETRILMDIPENAPSASVQNGGVKGHLRAAVLPNLPKSVQPSFLAALERGGLRSMPNSFLPSVKNKTQGLIILGDAMNMRHPLTGGGMTVGLNDVVTLRDLLCPKRVPSLSDTRLVMKQMSILHWRRKNTASVINILAQALYSLFAADDPNLLILQKGCFRYFELGMTDGPAGLLSGLINQPLVLFAHFYSVAFVSIWIFFRESPIYLLPWTIIRSFLVFWTACVVIFPYIFAELK